MKCSKWKVLTIILPIVLPLLLWCIPSEWIPIKNLTLVEHRVLVILVMAAFLWVLEPIPIFATSIVLIMMELLFVSNKGLIWFVDKNIPNLGKTIEYNSIFANFGSPIILLFISGFFLAIGSSKYKLDLNLSRVFTRPFGKRPSLVILGLMLTTAFFSCFMSNTATTAMMLVIVAPILNLFPKGDKGQVALCLSIPFAANIGGLGTPIGTPPNAVAMNYLPNMQFGTWMLFGMPYVFICIVLCWLILIWLYPITLKEIELKIEGTFDKSWRALVFYGVFLLTVVLWLTGFWHGMNCYVVAMIPMGIFVALKIITADEIKTMSWDVLWLITGGLALGHALEKSGLAQNIIESIPFESMSPLLIILIATAITFLFSNFMSHSAAGNLLLPIVAVLGTTESLIPWGGKTILILIVTFVCSLSMVLPISTPPNAMAHATGRINTKEMIKAGLLVGFMGIILIYFYSYLLIPFIGQ